MSLDKSVKADIQTSYSQFLKGKELQPRYGQKLMIAAIAKTLGSIELDGAGKRTSEGGVCVVEAGTGTGKTVAYLLGVIPIAKALGKKVVVSTATVALQEQIVIKDLPELKRHSGLQFEYALAKGRGRYLCLSKLDRILTDDTDLAFTAVDEQSVDLTPADIALYKTMMTDLSESRWDGDKDNWPEELDSNAWARVTTDHRQCTGRRCSFVRNCAFFKARDTIADMDLIVANHDLVLADLALGGGAILSDPQDTIYILDEGHHLAEKALNHFSYRTRLMSTIRWLGQTEGQWSNFLAPLSDASQLMELAKPVEAMLKETRTLLDLLDPHLRELAQNIAPNERSQQNLRYRFPGGEVGADIEQLAQALDGSFTKLYKALDKLRAEVERMLDADHGQVPAVDLEAAFPSLGAWCARAEGNIALWSSFSHTKIQPDWPMARWMTLMEFNESLDFELVSSPVLASKTLDDYLWSECCGAVVTSATLTALGSFDRFALRAGTPKETLYEAVPSPFNFLENAVLRVPKAAVEGNQAQQHTQSIIELLPSIVPAEQAALVLFSSRRQMEEVHAGLGASWQPRVLIQGVDSKQMLLTKHRAKIDSGQGSVLFGLASFAEGVDLPGKYCEHVVIAKIPFAVPDDPIESAMAEWVESQGGNAFMQISVPDAAIKLVQACGRLLRHEKDKGMITILDKRLLTKRYGAAILQSLPPFKQELNQ